MKESVDPSGLSVSVVQIEAQKLKALDLPPNDPLLVNSKTACRRRQGSTPPTLSNSVPEPTELQPFNPHIESHVIVCLWDILLDTNATL